MSGLSLGFSSTLIPAIIIALILYISSRLCYMYGIACAATGMVSIMSVQLTVEAFGPISDNAQGIAKICDMRDCIPTTTALDTAGNTASAIGKGYSISLSCLVAISLFQASLIRSEIDDVNLLSPIQFGGLIIGAMLPYSFSSLTLNSVANAAKKMMEEIKS